MLVHGSEAFEFQASGLGVYCTEVYNVWSSRVVDEACEGHQGRFDGAVWELDLHIWMYASTVVRRRTRE
jgi:hypothetical protein